MDLQEAITQAIGFARSAIPNEKLSVEEIEHEDIPPTWRITVGYKRELPQKKMVSPPGQSHGTIVDRFDVTPKYIEYEDVYKLVIVPEDGTTPSMKIRKV